ncbi:hypothetical protein ADUPG1_000885, partial [Aduncisulcus paluster]
MSGSLFKRSLIDKKDETFTSTPSIHYTIDCSGSDGKPGVNGTDRSKYKPLSDPLSSVTPRPSTAKGIPGARGGNGMDGDTVGDKEFILTGDERSMSIQDTSGGSQPTTLYSFSPVEAKEGIVHIDCSGGDGGRGGDGEPGQKGKRGDAGIVQKITLAAGQKVPRDLLREIRGKDGSMGGTGAPGGAAGNGGNGGVVILKSKEPDMFYCVSVDVKGGLPGEGGFSGKGGEGGEPGEPGMLTVIQEKKVKDKSTTSKEGTPTT